MANEDDGWKGQAAERGSGAAPEASMHGGGAGPTAPSGVAGPRSGLGELSEEDPDPTLRGEDQLLDGDSEVTPALEAEEEEE